MNLLVRLDVPLLVLGLSAILPQLWNWLRRPRVVCSSRFARLLQTVKVPLFYVGLIGLTTAGVDVGWAVWEQEYVFVHGGSSAPVITYMHRFPPDAEAPDFSLPSLEEDRSIRLSDFRGHKPVVLVFGSFS